jgi:hypothetical protein
LYVFNLPIFVAWAPLPPLLIAERASLSFATMEEATMKEEMNAEAPGATTFGQMTRDVLKKISIY